MTNRSQESVWEIGPRSLPVPVDLSVEVREILLNTQVPNIEMTRKFFSILQTREQWEAFIKSQNAIATPFVKTFAENLSVTIEKKQIQGITVHQLTPEEVDPNHKNHLFIFLRSGAFVLGRGETQPEAVLIAALSRITVLSVDFRMPPGHPFPAGLDDVVTVYKHLLKDHSAKSIALGGTSSGGNLALASTHKLIQLGLEVPGALFAGTPWVDLTKTGDSFYVNEGIDRILLTYDGLLHGAALLYGGGHNLKDPLISPVYGNFRGFPPTYLISGTRDLLLSATVRTHRKLRAARVEADLHVYEGLSHAEYTLLSGSQESNEHFAELNTFLLKHLQR